MPDKMLNIIKALHYDTQVKVRVNGKCSEPFSVNNGVKQGCVLAPMLFNIFIDFVLRKINERLGVTVSIMYRKDGKLVRSRTKKLHGPVNINHLMYADDMVIVAHTAEELNALVQELEALTQKFGLCISVAKTKTMSVVRDEDSVTQQIDIYIRGEKLEQVPVFSYLGSKVAADNGLIHEVSSRIQKAAGAFSKLKKTMWDRKELSLSTKMKVFDAVVMTSLLYGCETWTLKQGDVKRLETFHLACLRRILGKSRLDQIRNTEVRAVTNHMQIKYIIMQHRLRGM